MSSPKLDKQLGIQQIIEAFSGSQLVMELSVEAFDIDILPRADQLNKQCLHFDTIKPFTDPVCCKFKTFVATKIAWHVTADKQIDQPLQHILAGHPSSQVNRQTFPTVFVDDRQHLEFPAIACAIRRLGPFEL